MNSQSRHHPDNRTYRLSKTSQNYYNVVAQKVSKLTKILEVQLKFHSFNGIYPISVLRFLPSFQTFCYANGVHEGASMWLFQYWVSDPIEAALTARKTTKLVTRKDRNFRTYF